MSKLCFCVILFEMYSHKTRSPSYVFVQSTLSEVQRVNTLFESRNTDTVNLLDDILKTTLSFLP